MTAGAATESSRRRRPTDTATTVAPANDDAVHDLTRRRPPRRHVGDVAHDHVHDGAAAAAGADGAQRRCLGGGDRCVIAVITFEGVAGADGYVLRRGADERRCAVLFGALRLT